jgi:hypothetical protein
MTVVSDGFCSFCFVFIRHVLIDLIIVLLDGFVDVLFDGHEHLSV